MFVLFYLQYITVDPCVSMWLSLLFSGYYRPAEDHRPVKDVEEEDDDDDIDLFGSDDDDEEAEKLKEQRLKEYAEKKAKKPGLIAKSSILLDVKPVSLRSDRI